MSVSTLKRWLPLIILSAIMAAILASGLHREFSLEAYARQSEALDNWINANRLYAWFLLVIIYATSTALSLPIGLYLTLISGALLGGVWAGLAVILGATLGAVILFSVIRIALFEVFEQRFKPHISGFVEGFRANPLNYMLTLRLIPVAPFVMVNIIPALIGVRLRDYTLGTFFGIIPGTFAYTYLGAGFRLPLDEVSQDYRACVDEGLNNCSIDADLSTLIQPELLAGLGLLALLSLLPVLFKWWRRNHRTQA